MMMMQENDDNVEPPGNANMINVDAELTEHNSVNKVLFMNETQ